MSFETAFFEAAAGLPDQLPDPTLPEVVFSGRSNAGKSSLINRLLGRKSLARVSSSPGKTATINFYNLGFCRFVDLPGYGYAKVSKNEKLRWAELAEGYFRSQREIRFVIQLMDLRRAPSPDDRQMIGYLLERGLPCLIAATKCDKLGKTARAEQEALFRAEFSPRPDVPVVPCSAVTAEGVGEIREAILSACARPAEGGFI